MKKSVAFLIALLIFSACSKLPQADLIVTGKIWTGNSTQPWAEAMAVAGDSIVAVGPLSEVKKWEGQNSRKISASEGQLIVPGFIDTHTHFVTAGFNLSSVQLRDAKTKEEFVQRIADFAKTVAPGTWIMGGDWDNENWGG